jgi:flagellar basal-body rod protein FlgB
LQLYDSNFVALDAAIGAAGMRHQVLANNIANVNTPGFKRSDVKFDGLLAHALDDANASGNTKAITDLQPSVTVENNTVMRADGNNVDIDNEMASLAENNVRYNALVQMASKELNILKYVISDGRR